MHDIPAQHLIAPLVGQRLVPIGCSVNQVTFHFDGGAAISADASFMYSAAQGRLELVEIPLKNAAVMEILEQRVEAITVHPGARRLELRFDGGGRLEFESDRQYENFHIKVADIECHV